jgi:ATP-dependent exoDNAse (exonuclease V) beta subunit
MNNPDLETGLKGNKGYKHAELHEAYLQNPRADEVVEWDYFINFVKDHPDLKPYRTEWTIYDEDLKISGSIDMIYENSDGTLSIYDWKRSKDITRVNNFNKFAINKLICHMPDANFWHYALQLNTYKRLIERKYGKIVTDLYLVRLHPDAEEKNYELIKLPDLSKEIDELFEQRKQNLTVNN